MVPWLLVFPSPRAAAKQAWFPRHRRRSPIRWNAVHRICWASSRILFALTTMVRVGHVLPDYMVTVRHLSIVKPLRFARILHFGVSEPIGDGCRQPGSPGWMNADAEGNRHFAFSDGLFMIPPCELRIQGQPIWL